MVRRCKLPPLDAAEFFTDAELRAEAFSSAEGSDMMTSGELMRLLGYRCRKAFWQLVHNGGIPHVRLNSRVIRFRRDRVGEWIRQRSSD